MVNRLIIYTCMDVVSVLFFGGVCFSSRKTSDTLKTYGTGAHDVMHWSDARVIAYIRTCARVLLMQSWSCYEIMLSTMRIEKCFNIIINI